MDPVLKSIGEYGVTLVALVALAFLAMFFIRDLIKQRDQWRAIAESAVNAFDRLTDQLDVHPTSRPSRKSPQDRP